MSPASEVLIGFLRGAPAPERLENEASDTFQDRTITWLKGELKAHRALIWLVLGMECLNYFGIRLPGV